MPICSSDSADEYLDLAGLTDRFSLAAEMKLAPSSGAIRGSDSGVVELHSRQSNLAKRCRLEDITTPGLRWTVGGNGTLRVR